MPKFCKKLTSQEILSYPESYENGCLRQEVCFGIRNRGKDPQLPILDRQSWGCGLISD